MSLRSEREEGRNKVHMVLASFDHAVTSDELAASPLLEGMSRSTLGAYLRGLDKMGRAKRLAKGKWRAASNTLPMPLAKAVLAKAVKQEPRLVVKHNDEHPAMYFVLNPSKKTLQLDVGGLRLPVVIES